MRSQQARLVTLVGYFALLALVVLWQFLLFPSEKHRWLVGMIFVLPLLFPLPGIIRGKPYTHAWTSMLILLYFIHGVGEVFASPEQRLLAMLEILFSIQTYTGAILYARYRSRELKAKS